MHIPPVSSSHAAATKPVTASQVSAAIVKRADDDGDGKTGTAALNDGDAASQAAVSAAKTNAVNVKA